MTGKRWFYWLGKLHGNRKISMSRHNWPLYALEAYQRGWFDGLNEVSPFD